MVDQKIGKEVFKINFSNKVNSIPDALSIRINQLVYDLKRKGREIVVLSLGEAFFKIPAFDFMSLDFEKGYHYSDSQGIPELRTKIKNYYASRYFSSIDSNNILISAGSKPLLFFIFLALLNENDECLIHEPAWLSYQEQIRLSGGTPKFIPYQIDLYDFEEYFTSNTKILVLNNPNNPSGKVYSQTELEFVHSLCKKYNAVLVVDEAYSDFLPQTDFYSSINLNNAADDSVITINSLSKNMGMSGWRVGYAISSEAIIKQLLKINQHIVTCAPTILLYYMAKYFDDIIQVTLPQVKAVTDKRAYLNTKIKEIGLNVMPGSSTFYFFVKIENFSGTGIEFCIFLLLKYGISVVPGIAYGDSTEKFIRLSIGTEPEEKIIESLMIIKNLMNSDEFSHEALTGLLLDEDLSPDILNK